MVRLSQILKILLLTSLCVFISSCKINNSIHGNVKEPSSPPPDNPPSTNTLTVAITKGSGQPITDLDLPITFDFSFSEAIDSASFTADDIVNDGTALGLNWLLATTDYIQWTVTVTSISGNSGTIIPNLSINSVSTLSGKTLNQVDNTQSQVNFQGNLPPVLVDDLMYSYKDIGTFNFDILSNDNDPESDAFSVIKINNNGTSPINTTGGQVTINGNDISYTPNAGFFGPDVFTYTVQDSAGKESTGTVRVNVLHEFSWTGSSGDGQFTTNANWCGTFNSISKTCNNDGLAPSTTSHVASFDGICGSHCDALINTNLNLKGIELLPGYTGTLTQGTGNSITLGTTSILHHFLQRSGTFVGSSDPITIHGELLIEDGNFTATSGLLKIFSYGNSTNFRVSNSTTFLHNNGTLAFGSQFPSGAGNIIVDVKEGLELYNFNLGDSLRNNTSASMNYEFSSDNKIVVLNNLQIGPLSSLTADPKVNFTKGTIEVKGNLTVGYKVNGAYNKPVGNIVINGNTNQTYDFIDNTSIMPNLIVDTTGSFSHSNSNSFSINVNTLKILNGTMLLPSGGSFEVRTANHSASTITALQIAPAATLDLNGSDFSFGTAFPADSMTMYIDVPNNFEFENLHIGKTLRNYAGLNYRWEISSNKNIIVNGDLLLGNPIVMGSPPNVYLQSGTIESKKDVSFLNYLKGGSTSLIYKGNTLQRVNQVTGSIMPTAEFVVNNPMGVQLISNLTLNGSGHDIRIAQGNLDLNGNTLDGIDDLIIQLGGSLTKNSGLLYYVNCPGPQTCPVSD
ncbi:MAG: cadherin-like domain-containing protein [Bdellovibrionales bacterium]|nr:cadherin-like domain-containing protein [Bdellovibrionales bacterium]